MVDLTQVGNFINAIYSLLRVFTFSNIFAIDPRFVVVGFLFFANAKNV